MDKEILTNGGHGTVLSIKGNIFGTELAVTDLFSFEELKAKGLRLDSVVYALSGKMEILLWWKLEKDYSIMLPLATRGRLDWEAVTGLNSPKDATGIAISAKDSHENYFVINMDFTKR